MYFDELFGQTYDGQVDLDFVRHLLTKRPEILNCRDYISDTPLLWAVSWQNVELVGLLIELGAEVDPSVDDGFTSLHCLCHPELDQVKSCQIASTLVKAGAFVDRRGPNNYTPLHHAAVYGRVDLAKILVDHGADVNARTEIDCDETPLMEALRGDVSGTKPDTVRYLLSVGADPKLKDIYGVSAVEMIRKKYGDLAKELLQP